MEAPFSRDGREWERCQCGVDPESMERVVRLLEQRGVEAPEESKSASYRRVHERAGIPVDAIRAWVDRA